MFSKATVAICGLGGLGSNIAVALARAGVGKLILIDFDRVDASNINRQQYKASQVGLKKTEAIKANLREISTDMELVTHDIFVTAENAEELLKDADVVCEAFDNAESKAELVNAVLEIFPGKYLVAASGMAGMGDANSIVTRKITNKFYICGDGKSEVSKGTRLAASRVMVCAGHQAHKVLQILEERGQNENG